MQDDETTVETQDTQEQGQSVGEESTEGEEGTGESTETTESDITEAEAKVTLSPAEYRNFKKWQKAQKPTTTQSQTTNPQKVSSTSVEETVLLANGMPEELVNELKAVAAVRKTTLLKAQTDPIFVAVKEKFEQKQRQQDASLGASRGAGTAKAQQTFNSPGLSRDEHRKMVLESR